MVRPLGAEFPGPMLNRFGTGDGAGSAFPVKLNVRLASPVPVLVVNAGVPLFPPNTELPLPLEFDPKLGAPLLTGNPVPPKLGVALLPPKARALPKDGVALGLPKEGAAFAVANDAVLPKGDVALAVLKDAVVLELPKTAVALAVPKDGVALPKDGVEAALPKAGVALAALALPKDGVELALPKAGVAFVALALPKDGLEPVLPKAGVALAVKVGVALVLPNVGAAAPNAVDEPNVEPVPPNDGAAFVPEGLFVAPNENALGISLVDVFVNKLVELV